MKTRKESEMEFNYKGKTYNVKRVYNGKAKTCACGCAGNYSEDPRTIRRTVTKIFKAGITDETSLYFMTESATRMNVAYFGE
jgi:hypothetical protein